MHLSLLAALLRTERAILATVLRTEGHTYRKAGAHALFRAGDPFPVWGNLGSGCLDPALGEAGAAAAAEARPRIVRVDTTSPEDIDFGYGSYCGGVMEVLLAPVTPVVRAAARELQQRLAAGEGGWLVHDLVRGGLQLADAEPEPADGLFVERVAPPLPLWLFGATPLARAVVDRLAGLDFQPHIIDWREGYRASFGNVEGVTLHEVLPPLSEGSALLILSQHFTRDMEALRAALASGCGYVGLLGSATRREEMHARLAEAGVAREALARVRSPVGLDLGADSDPELAIAIVAELVAWRNR